MSRLTDLIRQARVTNPQLGDALEAEFRAITKERQFGLVFEKHQPEAVELPHRPVRRGDKVRVLPRRGTTAKGDQRLWKVTRIERADDARYAHLTLIDSDPEETDRVAADDLVVVAEFRDRIYPGLVETGRVERGGDKPFHTVINGENFHALEALTYTHRHAVDVIYIDPPYNTGARDWKYNNDYVGPDDDYRHSKWLSFMERRLLVAKELLNPDDSVLIVTIDEKEYLRLGLLLEQVFPSGDIQMVSNIINRAGSPRSGRFSRVDEYLYYVFFGSARVMPWVTTMLDEDMARSDDAAAKMPTVWFTAVRRGSGASRDETKNLFYPVVIDKPSGRFIRVGNPVPKGVDRHSVQLAENELAIWPFGKEGGENRWRFSAELMTRYFADGTARLGKRDPVTGLRPVTYLQPGSLENIRNGVFQVIGRTSEGSLILGMVDGESKNVVPRTVWNKTGHFARDHGSNLISAFLGGKRFDFPKSLYAVEDTLRFVVGAKPNAVVLDFFSGSGTTAHAVMRLNRQDNGRRTTISITNNEVGVAFAERLQKEGARPGDARWEALGICDYVTKPRIAAAICGLRPDGLPVQWEYKFVDEFDASDGFEENAAFFTLTYETPLTVSHNGAFERIAPLLWLRAGSSGRIIDNLGAQGWDVSDSYGVLENLDRSKEFVAALAAAPTVRIAYVVTDDDRRFQMVCGQLPTGVLPVRLYESYLLNFEVNTGRGIA